MRKKFLWLGLAALVVLLSLLWYWPQRVVVVQPQRQSLQQTLVFLGRIAAQDRIQLSAPSLAQVSQVLVEEGEQVVAGQELLLLDTKAAAAVLQQAQAKLEQQRLQLQQQRQLELPLAQNNLLAAQNKFNQTQQEWQRVQNLVQQQFYSANKLQDLQHELDIAKAQLDNARLQLNNATAQGMATHIVQTQLAQADAEVAQAQAELDKLTIRAPVDAVVVAKETTAGTSVTAGAPLLQLSPSGSTYVEATLDEKNLAFLQLGQSARVQADAFKQQFEAVLSYIAPAIDPRRGTVEVKFKVANPPNFLRPEMTVTVDMLVAEKTEALVLPKAVIYGLEQNDPWVYLVQDGKIAQQKIQPGIIGANYVEVAQGLAATAQVVLTPGVRLAQRVTTKLSTSDVNGN